MATNSHDDGDPEFEPFMQKGGRLVTTKTATLSMNPRGGLNVPGSVQGEIFDGAEFIRFHGDAERCLLALEGFADKESAPPNAYKISGGNGDESGGGSIYAEKVLKWLGKEPPEEHMMFSLEVDDGMPYIDVSDLPDVE